MARKRTRLPTCLARLSGPLRPNFCWYCWAVFNPLVNLLLLSFVFNRVAGVSTEGVPALLYGAVGLLGWTFFAEALSKAGDSLLANQNMVRKVYFPRLALPFSGVLSSLPDLLVGFGLVVLFMIGSQYVRLENCWGLLFLLPLLLLTAVTAGLWISALTMRFRDFRFMTPVLLRLGLFLVPIAYPVSQVPVEYQAAYFINPLAGIIEGLKWSLLGTPFPVPVAWLGLITLTVLFVTGLLFFSRVETKVADYL